jgi:uncharacterized protein
MSDAHIHLYSGKKFDLLNPNLEGITIEEVAHGLSQINRWTGQTTKPLSVAEHLCNCCDMCPDEHKLGALTHDVPEDFCNDVSKPLKNCLPDYQKIERNIEMSVAEQWNLPYPHHPVVKIVDNCMMVTEGIQLIKNFEKEKYDYIPYDIKIKCWSPRRAKKEFLKRYYKLRPEEKPRSWWNFLYETF